jgi:hypothetical protein
MIWRRKLLVLGASPLPVLAGSWAGTEVMERF